MPLHQPGHWLGAVVDLRTREIIQYDSEHGSLRDTKLSRIKESVARTFSIEAPQDSRSKAETWSIRAAPSSRLPKQHNAIDCGVFLCEFFRCIAFGEEFDFCERDMPFLRRNLCYELLKFTEGAKLPDLP